MERVPGLQKESLGGEGAPRGRRWTVVAGGTLSETEAMPAPDERPQRPASLFPRVFLPYESSGL
jgi:hypothetical protein